MNRCDALFPRFLQGMQRSVPIMVLLSVGFVPARTVAAKLSFKLHYIDQDTAWATSAMQMSLADLNGDGHLDMVQSECDTKTPVKIVWLKNDGHGHDTRHVIREGFKEDYHSLAVADFDNDGDLDIFTGSGPLASGPTSHNMYLFENTADPGHDPVYVLHDLTEFLSPEDAARLIAGFCSDHCHEPMSGDVNGDGTIDLVLKGWDGRDVDGQPQKPAPFIYLENTTGK